MNKRRKKSCITEITSVGAISVGESRYCGFACLFWCISLMRERYSTVKEIVSATGDLEVRARVRKTSSKRVQQQRAKYGGHPVRVSNVQNKTTAAITHK